MDDPTIPTVLVDYQAFMVKNKAAFGEGYGIFRRHSGYGPGLALQAAITASDLETIKLMVCNTTNIDAVITEWGSNALSLACGAECTRSNPKIVSYLLSLGASTQFLVYDPDFQTQSTILHIACEDGNLEIISLLLSQQPPPPLDTGDCHGETALHYLSTVGSAPGIQLLLQAGAKIQPDQNGKTPLHCAARSHSLESVQLLLSAGAKLHSLPSSPLFDAAGSGSYSITKLLLNLGCLADLEQRDSQNSTPLLASLSWGSRNPNENPTPQKPQGRTNWNSDREAVFWLLISRGANINITDNNQMTLLHHACRLNATSALEYLLAHGGPSTINSPSTAPQNGEFPLDDACPNTTPLHYSAQNQNPALTRILLDHGAEITSTDGSGRNALHHSTRSHPNRNGNRDLDRDMGLQSYETSRLLIDEGISIEARDERGRTPLHYVADWGGGDQIGATMKLLLENGADINVLDRGGKTPLWYACKRGCEWKIRLLRSYGADLKSLDEVQRLKVLCLEEGGSWESL